MRFAEWAYARSYVDAEPGPPKSTKVSKPKTPTGSKRKTRTSAAASTTGEAAVDKAATARAESPMYSISSLSSSRPAVTKVPIRDCCQNAKCRSYKTVVGSQSDSVKCIRCQTTYDCKTCNTYATYSSMCHSALTDCPRIGCRNNRKRWPGTCSNQACALYSRPQARENTSVQCPFYRTHFQSGQCRNCSSVLSECSNCPFNTLTG